MTKQRTFIAYIAPLMFRYTTLTGLGFCVFFLWNFSGLQHHESWGRFYAVWIPIVYATFSTAYVFLKGWASNRKNARGFLRLIACFCRYDEYTYVFPLAILAAIVAGPLWKNVFLWLSVVYLALVIVKSGIFLTCLFLSLRRTSALLGKDLQVSRTLKILLILAALVPYCAISAYHQQRIGLTGDEPHYLLITHSLLHDRDSNLHNNYEHRDYQHFFQGELRPTWGDRVSKTEVYSYRHKGGFPATLIPAYALGGRFGATLQMNLVTALLMLQLFLLSYEIFQALTASFATWFCMAFSLPLLVYMGQMYPEPLAALFAVWSVRHIRLLGTLDLKSWAFWRQSLLIGGACTLMVLLKTRYVPLAGTLSLFWGWEIFQNRLQARQKIRAAFGLLSVLLIAGALVLLADRFFLDGMFFDRIGDRKYMLWMLKGHNPFHGWFGLLFDQEYGLLFYSPLYGLALVGMGLVSRTEWPKLAPFAMLFALNSFVVAAWSLWHAAPTPPSRYLLPLLPFLGIFLTKYFAYPGLFVKRIAFGVSGVWTFLMAWTLTLNPWWRYNWADGTNNFLEMQNFRLTMNVNRLFPSFSRLSPMTWHVTLLGIISIIAVLSACRFEGRKGKISLSKHLTAEYSAIMILLFFLSLLAGTLGLGKVLATDVIEAEDKVDVTYQGGRRTPESLDPWNNQIYLREWKHSAWALAPGDFLTIRPKLSHSLSFLGLQHGDARELQIFARVQIEKKKKLPELFPVLRIVMNGNTLGKISINSTHWEIYSMTISAPSSQPTLMIVHEKTQEAGNVEIIVDKIKFL